MARERMKQRVIYKGRAPTAGHVLNVLRKHGIPAVQVENISSTVVWTAKGTYRVRIAVPEDQVPQARDVLAEWERSSAPRADRLAKTFWRHVLVAMVIAAGITTAHRLLVHRTLDQIDWGHVATEFMILSFVTLVVLANFARLTRKRQ